MPEYLSILNLYWLIYQMAMNKVGACGPLQEDTNIIQSLDLLVVHVSHHG